MTRVLITVGSDVLTMDWSPAHAGAPILVDGEATPYQTADARHEVAQAVSLAVSYMFGAGTVADNYEITRLPGC